MTVWSPEKQGLCFDKVGDPRYLVAEHLAILLHTVMWKIGNEPNKLKGSS